MTYLHPLFKEKLGAKGSKVNHKLLIIIIRKDLIIVIISDHYNLLISLFNVYKTMIYINDNYVFIWQITTV